MREPQEVNSRLTVTRDTSATPEQVWAVIADGWTSHACVDAKTLRPTRIPQTLADAIARAEASSS